MWFKHKAWIPVAWILSLINLGAVWFAAMPGEAAHATGHAVLAVLFGLGAQYLAHRRDALAEGDLERPLRELEAEVEQLRSLPSPDPRMAELEERLDFMERALVEVRSKVPTRPADGQPG